MKRDCRAGIEADTVAYFKAETEDCHEIAQSEQPVMEPRFKPRTDKQSDQFAPMQSAGVFVSMIVNFSKAHWSLCISVVLTLKVSALYCTGCVYVFP
jgi:hypothetical protein